MNLIGTKEKEDELTRDKASDRFQSISLITLSTRMITHTCQSTDKYLYLFKFGFNWASVDG